MCDVRWGLVLSAKIWEPRNSLMGTDRALRVAASKQTRPLPNRKNVLPGSRPLIRATNDEKVEVLRNFRSIVPVSETVGIRFGVSMFPSTAEARRTRREKSRSVDCDPTTFIVRKSSAGVALAIDFGVDPPRVLRVSAPPRLKRCGEARSLVAASGHARLIRANP